MESWSDNNPNATVLHCCYENRHTATTFYQQIIYIYLHRINQSHTHIYIYIYILYNIYLETSHVISNFVVQSGHGRYEDPTQSQFHGGYDLQRYVCVCVCVCVVVVVVLYELGSRVCRPTHTCSSLFELYMTQQSYWTLYLVCSTIYMYMYIINM